VAVAGLVLGGLTFALMVAALPLAAAVRHQSAASNAGVILLFVPFAAVGMLLAYRQPGNSLGWILTALALLVTLGTDAGLYAVLVYRTGHHGLPLGRLAVALAPSWVPVLGLLPLPILLFPDGRIPRGRWRWAFWVYLALVTGFLVSIAIADANAFTERHLVLRSDGELAALFARPSRLASWFADALIVGYVAVFLSSVLRQLLRYRTSSGDERQQLKWLTSGGTVAVGGVLLASVVGGAASPAFFGVVALPLALGVAVLKYRLYELDRLISRTLSYALLTTMLAGVFVGIVVLLTDVLPISSPVAVAASTLAAAALFNPLRLRTQWLIDRRFNRARYDAQATVASFGGRLRDALDVDAISGELVHVVAQTMAPVHASLWMRPKGPS
jgi:hypothetical protein